MISSLILPYRASDYRFRTRIQTALGGCTLERLHEFHAYDHFTRETDQSTELHRSFYDYTKSATWTAVYADFIREISEWFGETLVYQRVPTFRIQFPGNVSVGEPHKDKTYNHSPDEVNIWVPLTKAVGTAAVWCESAEDAGDYRPLECPQGRALVFDAANLRHMNRDNKEGYTRVSFDLRVIPKSRYVDRTDGMTINTNLPFRLPRHADELTYFTELDR